MSSVPPITPPPPPPPPPPKKLLGVTLTADAGLVWRKASTWLGILAAGSGGALGAYILAPERAQNLVPEWVLMVLIGLAMVSGFAVGIATSIKQRALKL